VPGPRGEPPPFVFATPAEAAALLLDSLGAAPVDHVFFWADAPGLDPEIARRHVELLCTELGPLVSGAAPRPD
jgi:hypothetical protein